MSASILDQVVTAQKRGEAAGIPSVCSAHPDVIGAALAHALDTGATVLIESTCNQVNQYGGYTGMTPANFVRYVHGFADAHQFPDERLLLGGDHLGPNVWQDEPAHQAMDKARVMVRDYVLARYTKIHLDTSMHLADDPKDEPLSKEVTAARAAMLAETAEAAYQQLGPGLPAPRYIIGTEVPPPGGIQGGEDSISVTPPADVEETITITRQAFRSRGLDAAWERVIAVVVQPGVEYGDEAVFDYQPALAADLSRAVEPYDRLVYEAHSTDYQTRAALRNLVRDHFAILKVGPALTLAYREAVFALAVIEGELLAGRNDAQHSHLLKTLDAVMLRQPEYWRKYYHGDSDTQRLARRYSFSDRIRYYWPVPEVQAAVETLIRNLTLTSIPLTLLSQYLPDQYRRIREGQLTCEPLALIRDKIVHTLADYSYACGYHCSD